PLMIKRQKEMSVMAPSERIKAIGGSWPIMLVAFTMLGGIYTGFFTPTESAATGCLMILVIGFLQVHFRKLGGLSDALKESANTTSMFFLINLGALLYAKVLTLSQVPGIVNNYLVNLDVPPITIIIF